MGVTTNNVTGTYRRLQYNSDGSIWSDTTTNVPNAMVYSDSRPDRSRTRKPTGWLPPKAYSLLQTATRRDLGTTRTYNTSGNLTSVWSGFVPSTPTFGTESNHLLVDGFYDKALLKCLMLLKDEKLNLGVAIGEYKATARTVGDGFGAINRFLNKAGDNLSRVAGAYRAVKRGDVKKAARILRIGIPKKAPSQWLQYQYGWLPLLSDIHGSAEALGKGIPNNLNKGVKAWAGQNEKIDVVKINGNFASRFKGIRTAGVFVRLDYEPSNTFLQSIAGVGLTNPASVAWELVPFSFVMDWALPLGDYLGALDADLGWRFKTGSASTFRRVSCQSHYSHSPTGLGRGDYAGSKRMVDFQRTVINSPPGVPFPRFKNPFSLGHAANGLSLLAEAVKKTGK